MTSSGLPAPVVAPWTSSWSAYSTQIQSVPFAGPHIAQVAVPAGLFWRPLYFSFTYATDASAGNRLLEFAVLNPDGASVLSSRSPQVQAASLTVAYLFMPLVGAYATVVPTNAGFMAVPYPDLIWQFGYTFQVQAFNAAAGDTLSAVSLAVETFTEDSDGQLVPVSEPLASPIVV